MSRTQRSSGKGNEEEDPICASFLLLFRGAPRREASESDDFPIFPGLPLFFLLPSFLPLLERRGGGGKEGGGGTVGTGLERKVAGRREKEEGCDGEMVEEGEGPGDEKLAENFPSFSSPSPHSLQRKKRRKMDGGLSLRYFFLFLAGGYRANEERFFPEDSGAAWQGWAAKVCPFSARERKKVSLALNCFFDTLIFFTALRRGKSLQKREAQKVFSLLGSCSRLGCVCDSPPTGLKNVFVDVVVPLL